MTQLIFHNKVNLWFALRAHWCCSVAHFLNLTITKCKIIYQQITTIWSETLRLSVLGPRGAHRHTNTHTSATRALSSCCSHYSRKYSCQQYCFPSQLCRKTMDAHVVCIINIILTTYRCGWRKSYRANGLARLYTFGRILWSCDRSGFVSLFT